MFIWHGSVSVLDKALVIKGFLSLQNRRSGHPVVINGTLTSLILSQLTLIS